jgi:predicted DNA binding CopG/RHH family protein
MRFVWSEVKNRPNLVKHALSFAEAAKVLTIRVCFVPRPRSRKESSVIYRSRILQPNAVERKSFASSACERRRRLRGEVREKTTTQTMTMEEVRKWKIPKAEMERARQVDTSDIPELANFAGGVRGRFYQPLTQSVTIRLNASDIEAERQLSKVKGMPYQTYIRGLLHAAVVREAKLVPVRRRKS